MGVKLIVFDVDGTLVDSQGSIVSAMTSAFDAYDLEAPARSDILSIVGLSLDQAICRLAPEQPVARRAAMVAAYKSAFQAQRL